MQVPAKCVTHFVGETVTGGQEARTLLFVCAASRRVHNVVRVVLSVLKQTIEISREQTKLNHTFPLPPLRQRGDANTTTAGRR